MKTFKTLFSSFIVASVMLVAPITQAASQCTNTAWQKSNGRTCANLGLDSKKAVCNGQPLALFCDDTRTEIRTCPSTTQCAAKAPAQNQYNVNNQNSGNGGWAGGFRNQNQGGNQWSNQGNGQWNGQSNNQGGYGNQRNSGNDFEYYRGKQFHCTEYDYRKNRPCSRGKFNDDCKGSCT